MKYICKTQALAIRKMEDCLGDYTLVSRWLSDPKVLKYYEGRDNAFDLEKTIKKFRRKIVECADQIPCIMEYEEKAIGYLQYYKADLEEYASLGKVNLDEYLRPYALDLFIGESDYWDKGLGSKIIKLMLKHIFKVEWGDSVFIDPQTWNVRAIKCYEKSGFTPLALIEKGELHEGEYRDNLIMIATPS